MKKVSKIMLICIFSLMCALCIGAAVGVSAETGDGNQKTVSVEYANLKFENEVYMLFAVGSSGIEDTANIELLVWQTLPSAFTADDNPDFTLSVYNEQEINGISYPVFMFDKYSAKQMADDVYVCAYYSDGASTIYSEPVKYSVIQYVYNMRNVGNADQMFIEMLDSMLSYGANAQRYFNYNLERPADAGYIEISVNGGTLEDGFDYGLYCEGQEFTVTAPAQKDGHAFVCWVNSNGERIGEGQSQFTTQAVWEMNPISAVYDVPVKLTDIYVDSMCNLNEYPYVSVSYNDGTYNTIDFSELDIISGSFDNTVAATYNFTVSYEGFEKEVTVQVKDPSQKGIKEIFVEGECYLNSYPYVYVVYDTGEKVEIDFSELKIVIGEFNNEVAATYNFTVSYEGFEKEVTVQVKDPSQKAIKDIFVEGQCYLGSNPVVSVFYDTGESVDIDFSELTIVSGEFNNQQAGEYAFTVEYEGYRQDVWVLVIEPEDTNTSGISIEGSLLYLVNKETKSGEFDLTERYIQVNNNYTSDYIMLTEGMIKYDPNMLDGAVKGLEEGEQYCEFYVSIEYEGSKIEGVPVFAIYETSLSDGSLSFSMDRVVYFENDSTENIKINKDGSVSLEGYYLKYRINKFDYMFTRPVRELYDENGALIDDYNSYETGVYKCTIKSEFNPEEYFTVSLLVYTDENLQYEISYSDGIFRVEAGTSADKVREMLTGKSGYFSEEINFGDQSSWGTSDFIILTEDMFVNLKDEDFATVGNKALTLVYEGKNCRFDIQVLPSGEGSGYTYYAGAVQYSAKVYEGYILVEGMLVDDMLVEVDKILYSYENTEIPNVIKINTGENNPELYYLMTTDENGPALMSWIPSEEGVPTKADGEKCFNMEFNGEQFLVRLVAADADNADNVSYYLEMYIYNIDDGSKYHYCTIDVVVEKSEGKIVKVSGAGLNYEVVGSDLVAVG